ncbi:MAG: CAP domain-containing protein [Oscillatoriales cyanobacterium RM2_1_1]|nr:CAP domain-containing protein [Oscillatoriales cyanobacterium SM2_3_0]NJO46976.1 CAP domain-containing protein [Oscillatoriales cyanobacterium RM2_1_1]
MANPISQTPSQPNKSLAQESNQGSNKGSDTGSGDFAAMEQAIYQQVNQYRADQNLPPLKSNPQIAQQSRNHSLAIARGQVPMGHTGFERRADIIGQSIPYQQIAENVAFNSGYNDPAIEAVKGWIKSDGHRRNIKGEYDLTGVGVARNPQGEYYFTQIFVHSR